MNSFHVLFSPDLRPNRWLHFGQTCYFIFLCTHSIWVVKFCLVPNPLLQIWQTWFLIFLCTVSICFFRLCLKEQSLAQKLHWWGLSFSWTDCMWPLREFEWQKHLLQIWHWNFLFFSWMVSMWRFKLEIQLNILLHSLHSDDVEEFDWAIGSFTVMSLLFFLEILLVSLACFFLLWKYFMWIVKPGKLRNFLLHRMQLSNFCLFNVVGSY